MQTAELPPPAEVVTRTQVVARRPVTQKRRVVQRPIPNKRKFIRERVMRYLKGAAGWEIGDFLLENPNTKHLVSVREEKHGVVYTLKKDWFKCLVSILMQEITQCTAEMAGRTPTKFPVTRL